MRLRNIYGAFRLGNRATTELKFLLFDRLLQIFNQSNIMEIYPHVNRLLYHNTRIKSCITPVIDDSHIAESFQTLRCAGMLHLLPFLWCHVVFSIDIIFLIPLWGIFSSHVIFTNDAHVHFSKSKSKILFYSFLSLELIDSYSSRTIQFISKTTYSFWEFNNLVYK